jgi:phosphoribosylanthranilate isomerase
VIVKVCGVRSAAIAEAALDAGADWIGVVFEPRSPRHVRADECREVAAAVRGRGSLVGVMVSPTLTDCESAVQRFRLDAVQVHGSVDPTLAAGCPVPVIPGINHRAGATAPDDPWWPDCMILLDASPGSDGALPGGTGTRVDMVAAAAMARHRPLILAGGLHAGNVAAAIEAVRPRGVDASSGLEATPGEKDRGLVIAYVRAARSAAAALDPGGEA